jgi:RHS repeat-associated protein
MIESSHKQIVLDVLGRPRQIFITDGEVAATQVFDPTKPGLFADILYDDKSRVASVALPDGSVVAPKYDEYTLGNVGFVRYTPNTSTLSQLETSVRYDNRGLIHTEKQESPAGMLERTYGYNAQGFLMSSVDAQQSYTYTYANDTGLNTSIGGSAITTSGVLGASGSTVTLASAQLTHTFDALGRVVKRKVGSATTIMSYGPNDQIASVIDPTGAQYDYVYDESGQRLAKVRHTDGKIVLAYLGAGVHDGSALTRPVSVAGIHVGTLRKGVFEALATDARGTVLGAPAGTGTSSMPSPYGTRATLPDVAWTTSFIRQPFDRDLGLVRLGMRDYDPQLGRFVQPDPLYREVPVFGLGDHVGANLFGYASNDPVNFVDPLGLRAKAKAGCIDENGMACAESGGSEPPACTQGGEACGSDLRNNGDPVVFSDADEPTGKANEDAVTKKENYAALVKTLMSDRVSRAAGLGPWSGRGGGYGNSRGYTSVGATVTRPAFLPGTISATAVLAAGASAAVGAGIAAAGGEAGATSLIAGGARVAATAMNAVAQLALRFSPLAPAAGRAFQHLQDLMDRANRACPYPDCAEKSKELIKIGETLAEKLGGRLVMFQNVGGGGALPLLDGVSKSGPWYNHVGVLLPNGAVLDPLRNMIFQSIPAFVQSAVGSAPVQIFINGAMNGNLP